MGQGANQSAGRGAAQKKGGEPEGRRRSHFPMLNVVKTTAGSKDQQTVTDYIHEGIVTLSPLQMNAVIKECGYDGQRPVNDRHVIVLADLMQIGRAHV